MHKRLSILAAALMLALLAAACGGTADAPEETSPNVANTSADAETTDGQANAPADEIASPPVERPDAPADNGGEPMADAEADEAEEPMSGNAEAATDEADEAAADATAKTDYVPTDPSTVQLAAGEPQLVKFFAFW